MTRIFGVVGAVTILGTIIEIGACTSSPETQPVSSTSATGASGSTGGSGGGNFYSTSLCGTCVLKACASEQAACDAEPGCSARLECLLHCPVGANGDADPTCEQGCPGASGTAAQSASDAFEYCRTSGPGTSCAAPCGDALPDGGSPETCKGNPILTQQCKPSQEPDPCYKCQFEKCCDSVDACFNGGPATDLSNCWLECMKDDIACQLACFDKYPDGVVGFGGYTACLYINCFAAGAGCVSSKQNDCSTCQTTECCEELAACNTDAECYLITQCALGCKPQDSTCGGACVSTHSQGKATWAKLALCTTQKCLSKCGS